MIEQKGFTFGKFLPFHKGHEAMIRFAKSRCRVLTVLICCSDREEISCAQRMQWMVETFKSAEGIEVLSYIYNEDELPNTSVSSELVSAIWAKVFKSLLPKQDLLVTSEPYGDMLARCMGIRHIAFDLSKKLVPVSASLIRNNPTRYWQFLPASVKPFYAKKIVLLGTESTGKSTLTTMLAAHYKGTPVQEAGRDLIADSNDFSISDLYAVAHAHAERITAACKEGRPLVFIDTDVRITQSYATFVFGQELQLPSSVYEANKAALYLYLCNDVAHVQDGTRLDEVYRNKLDASHRETLSAHRIVYHEIAGNWEERLTAAITIIDSSLARAEKDLR